MMDAMRPPSPSPADGGRTPYLLPGGLTTIALAYPAVMATGNARMALAAGIFILIIPLLVWATRYTLRQLAPVHIRVRVCDGAGVAIFLHILYAGILWLILDATAWFPLATGALPLLAAPLLLGFAHPSLGRAETDAQPARPASPWTILRPLLTGCGIAAVLCMSLGLLREWLMTGTVFAAAVPTVNQTGMPVAVPLGLILAGFLFGLARWTANRIRRWAERGML